MVVLVSTKGETAFNPTESDVEETRRKQKFCEMIIFGQSPSPFRG